MFSFSLRSLVIAAAAILPYAAALPTPEPATSFVASSNMGNIVADNYIIKLRGNTTAEEFEAHTSWVEGAHSNRLRRRDDKTLVGQTHKYAFGNFYGYSGAYDADTVESIRNREEVEYVEEDKIVVAYGMMQQSNVRSWGLARVSTKNSGNETTYYYDSSAGSGVTAYVIDTGVLVSHEDFEGRATFGYNAAGDGNDRDGVGHGTHVAGTIAGKTFGIAKKANIIAVKVLGSDGSGTNSAVIAGVQWAAQDAKTKGKSSTSVANMSLGGSFSKALNDVVASAIASGITFAVAAGNDGKDAANYSPASVQSAITVGATTSGDSRASYSNYGSLVDIFGPGTGITSSWNTCNNCVNTISGTSMATPHVTGMCAYFIGMGLASSPSDLQSMIRQIGTQGIVKNPGPGTTSTLLYNKSGY